MPGLKPTDLSGRQYGRLTVVSYAGTTGNGAKWHCRCECGADVTLPAIHLTRTTKPSRSCGCLQRERVGDAARTHGRTKTPEYSAWRAMVARCTRPNDRRFKNYGARGITVCDRWRNSFEAFLADMGERPSPNHSIERVDNDGPYSPENCVWATYRTQSRNKRSNHRLTYQGETLTLRDWSARTGINYSTLHARIRYGWTVKRILTEPVQVRTF